MANFAIVLVVKFSKFKMQYRSTHKVLSNYSILPTTISKKLTPKSLSYMSEVRINVAADQTSFTFHFILDKNYTLHSVP